MAKLKLAPFLTEVSGHLGNMVYYNVYGEEYARVYVKPMNPDTEEQKIVRNTFGNAVRSWQSLSADEQRKYNTKAYRLRKKGYNLYISLYMKDNMGKREIKRDNKTISTAAGRYSDSTMIGGYSVAAPFFFYNRSNSGSIHTVCGYAAG